MNILFDHDIFQNYRYGGISRYIVELHKALRFGNYCEANICSSFCDNEYLDNLEDDAGLIGNWPFLKKLPKGKRMIRELIFRNACHRKNPDIVHGTFFYRNRIEKPVKRFVITLHDMTNELLPSYFGKDDKMPAFKRAAVERADHVICISEQTRVDAMKIYNLPAEKFSVVHHGAILLPSPDPLPDALEGVPYLLFVGQRKGYKNFSSLLSAYASSARLKGDFVLVCCGGGSLTIAEIYMISKLGIAENRVMQISGSDAVLASLYKGATAMIYPSLYEGFGMPILEAFGMNCPVIASRLGAMPEVGGNGVEYFEDQTPVGMAYSIEAIVYNAARVAELRALGRTRLSQFSWDSCARETSIVYNNTLSKQY